VILPQHYADATLHSTIRETTAFILFFVLYCGPRGKSTTERFCIRTVVAMTKPLETLRETTTTRPPLETLRTRPIDNRFIDVSRRHNAAGNLITFAHVYTYRRTPCYEYIVFRDTNIITSEHTHSVQSKSRTTRPDADRFNNITRRIWCRRPDLDLRRYVITTITFVLETRRLWKTILVPFVRPTPLHKKGWTSHVTADDIQIF